MKHNVCEPRRRDVSQSKFQFSSVDLLSTLAVSVGATYMACQNSQYTIQLRDEIEPNHLMDVRLWLGSAALFSSIVFNTGSRVLRDVSHGLLISYVATEAMRMKTATKLEQNVVLSDS
jgi:hypothetical protein